MSNYKILSSVPEDALKTIGAGRLRGMSDINPQWRYEMMTEVYGQVGFGWYFNEVNREFREDSKGQVAVFVDIELFVKDDDDWSKPIKGNGGSMFITDERNGLYTSDEAVKMATTDALSTAMKLLGVGADVYRGYSDSKYVPTSSSPVSKDANPVNIKWLSEKNFNIALNSDVKGINATLKAYTTSDKKMNKEYKQKLKDKLKELGG